MTEDEAKTKWCPFTRATASDTEWHSNRPSFADTDKSPFDTCLGSTCMAWCPSHTVRGPVIERMRAEPGSKKPEGGDWGYEAVDPERASAGGEWVRWAPGVAHGGCGLAGAPQ